MKITSVSVRGYRTIKEEVRFDIDRMITLVGPNNSGKTNTLKGIHSFFTGYENDLGYSFDKDMCKGERSLRTNVQLGIGDFDPVVDRELIDIIVQVRSTLEITTGSEAEIILYLTFSPNSNPVYRVFPNAKRPTGSDGVAYSRLEKRLFEFVLGKFSIHYIPSEKSVGDLYRGLVLPHLFKRMYNTLAPHLNVLDAALGESASQINEFLVSSGLGGYKASFELPKRAEAFF